MSPPLTTDRGVADERDIRKCWAGRTSPLGCCLGTRCRLDDGQTPWAEWERFQCMGEGRQLPRVGAPALMGCSAPSACT